MGVALVTQHIVNTYQEEQGNVVLATKGTPDRNYKMKHFSYKGEWANV